MDRKRNNTFVKFSEGECGFKNAEPEDARNNLKELKRIYYNILEKSEIQKGKQRISVIYREDESKMLIKFDNCEQCCEYCYP